MPDLSIVIPAYREEDRLPGSMEKIQRWIEATGRDVEIVVVAEGSPDRTKEVARELAGRYGNIVLLENEARMGKGYTVRRGLLASTAPLAAFTDADLSIPIEDVENLLVRMAESGADAVVGRRLQADRLPLHRKMLTWGFRTATRLITDIPLKETQCGCKLFTREFIEDVFPLVEATGFGFDVEVIALGLSRGWAVTDAEVRVYHDERSTVDPIRDSWDMLKQLFRTRVRVREAGRQQGRETGVPR